MDENILDVLFECDLIQNKQQNPTKEFVLKVMLNFCDKLGIDGSVIQKPLFEQVQSAYAEVLYEDIKVINLQTALSQIFEQIFLKEFSITDITNPSVKRACKVLKTLTNFCLYYNGKNYDIEERKKDMYIKYERLQHLVQETKKQQELTVEIQKKTGILSSENENLRHEIEKLQSEMRNFNNESENIKAKIKNANVVYKEIIQKYGILKEEHVKQNENISNMESKVVKSPNTYKSKLKMLTNEKEEKMAQRDETLTSVAHKKKMLEMKEQFNKFISVEHKNLEQYLKILRTLKELVENKEFLKQQLEQIEKKICKNQEDQRKENEQKQYKATKIDELKIKSEQQLLTIREERDTLLMQKSLCDKNLKETCLKHKEIMELKANIVIRIKKLESEIKQNIEEYQNVHDNEIKEEIEFRKLIDSYV